MSELYNNSDIDVLLSDHRVLTKRMFRLKEYREVTGRDHELVYLVANAIAETEAVIDDIVPTAFTREFKAIAEV